MEKYSDIKKENKALLNENDFLRQSEKTSSELNRLYLEEINNHQKEILILKKEIFELKKQKL